MVVLQATLINNTGDINNTDGNNNTDQILILFRKFGWGEELVSWREEGNLWEWHCMSLTSSTIIIFLFINSIIYLFFPRLTGC